MFDLFKLELYKLRRQRSVLLAIGAVLLIDLVALAVAYGEGKALLDFATSNLQDTLVFKGQLLNGSLVSLLILNSLWFHLPLIVMIVSASLVASEYKDGSLRNVLCRPVRRSHFIAAKFLCIAAFSAGVVLLLGISSLGLSYAIFGSGDLLVFMDTLNILPAGEAFWRLVGAFAFGMISMVTLGLMAGTLATILESPVSSIIVSTFLLIVLTIIDKSGYLAGSWLENLFLVSNVGAWQELFFFEIAWSRLVGSLFWLFGYCTCFFILGWWNFRRKDISC